MNVATTKRASGGRSASEAVNDAAAAWRAASSGREAGGRDRAEGRLVRAGRALARGVLGGRVPADVADDLAQEVVLKVLVKLRAGGIEAGREAAYVATAARNAGVSWHRRETPARSLHALLEEDKLADGSGDALDSIEAAERRSRDEALLAEVAQIIARAPLAYRDALIAVCRDGVPVEVLAARELAARGEASSDGAAWERARDSVYKRVQRGKRWVMRRLTAGVLAAAAEWLSAGR